MQEYLYNLATDKSGGVIASLIKMLLFLLSSLYGLAVRTLILFYRLRPCRMSCKVISVGNITLGGTGKTSLVEYIARYLKAQGHKVAIITRGYKRKITSYELRATSYESMGDEPFMLFKNLSDVPVIVDSDRIKATLVAIRNYSVDTVILDDAFQQWKIKKDLDIVTVDSTNPFGNRRLIPRGILREPLASLKRADIFILTKTNINPSSEDLKNYLNSVNPTALILQAIHKPVGFYKIARPEDLLAVDTWKGKTATLFSGIGDPSSFENLVAGLGIKIGLAFRFRDHHSYTQADLDKITGESQEKKIDTIITTEKDAVRLVGSLLTMFGSSQLLVLRIAIEIKNEQEFNNRLRSLYSL